MPNQASHFEQQASRAKRSPYERLRLHGAVRGAIIAYGIGAVTFYFPLPMASAESPALSPATGALKMLLVGIGLQLLVLVVRRLVAGYGQTVGREGYLPPVAVFLSELLVDGVTVLVFALATFRSIAQYGSGI